MSVVLEPERYELDEPRRYRFAFGRRAFFKRLGGGLLVLSVIGPAVAQESGRSRRHGGAALPSDIDAWLHIDEDGKIKVFTGKAEVGQNARTSLTEAVAEELRVDCAVVELVMADTQLTPFDMGTFGSQTTPQMASRLHRVAATAREALLQLAAERWPAQAGELRVANGKISNGSSSLTFAELTHGQKLVKTVVDSAPVTLPNEWKIAGTSVPKINGRRFVTGGHQYASDIKLEGMLHGRMVRPAGFHAKLESVDSTKAAAMPGVKVVQDGEFIGVTAADDWTAGRAAEAITAKWAVPPQSSNATLFDDLRKSVGGGAEIGTSDEFKNAAHTQRATYTIAYIAHTPLEPRAAVAQWTDGKLTVWTGSQRPFGVRTELAETFGLPESAVRVIVPDTGAGYGGKHSGEAAIEAARLARAVGRPVKLVWTRQEEFTWAYFRPAGVIEIVSAAREDGTIAAWEMHNFNSGASAIHPPYDIAWQKCEFHRSESPLRQGSYRALAATANNFARESHIDDIAHALRVDPLEFRLKNLREPRLRDVLRAATEAFGWKPGQGGGGRGFGLSAGMEKGACLATCVEVRADSDGVQVMRAVCAFDAGAVRNPNQLKNQVEGALMMGLGGALFEAVEFDNGKIANGLMAKYRVPRFTDLPKIDVVLIDRKDVPSAGAGETPIIGIAPAIGNAIFNAAGARLRSLPMAPQGLKA